MSVIIDDVFLQHGVLLVCMHGMCLDELIGTYLSLYVQVSSHEDKKIMVRLQFNLLLCYIYGEG